MHQIIHHHPRGLRLHPDCVSADDVHALKAICRAERREFTPDAMIHIYDHTDDYRDHTVITAHTHSNQFRLKSSPVAVLITPS